MSDSSQQDHTIDKLDFEIKPPIYSSRAIWGFSFFFTPLFGGILLMQNLKDINKRKEANIVLLIAILLTIAIITIVIVFDIQSNLPTLIFNIIGSTILSTFLYKKYIPGESDYEKKKTWKPLLIGIGISIALIIFIFWAQDQAVVN